jgi:putative ABC transport system ATP-binding protein
MSPAAAPLLVAEGLRRVYRRGSESIAAVDGVSFRLAEGEFVAFVGPSGSGKSTLLHLLGCLDNPSSGRLEAAGRTVFDGARPLAERALTRIRRELFGYVFQRFYLIPTLTVEENVRLPFAFFKKAGAEAGVEPLLDLLGLAARRNHLPGQLSGGEMQRVAIARALVNRPRILLADEPTGNLDVRRSEEIGVLLRTLNRRDGLTIVLVTHNPGLARLADRVVELRDGRLAPPADSGS